MVKRFIDCNTSDYAKMSPKDILESIRASEGRVIISEIIGAAQPLLFNISNAELACAFGADILLLNMFDVFNPIFNGINSVDRCDIIKEIKRLTGRIIGINLEPITDKEKSIGEILKISKGRTASIETAKKAYEMGADMLVLTGNPKTAVSNKAIAKSISEIKNELGDKIIVAAGKMHCAGIFNEVGNNIIKKEDIKEFIDSGCDIVLLPAPGTVPGITMEYIKELVEFSHKNGILTITAIGTSQEGADEYTIKNIALMCKMTGTDIHHIGDAGYPGIAIPENIMDYSISIRGKRHTYSRIARSINR